jgi:hypothetical protein
MASGHEARAKEAASEVLKGNAIIERLQVGQTGEGAAGRVGRDIFCSLTMND